jgi:dihydroorotase
MKIYIRNGRIIDPSQGLDTVGDIVIDEGKIAEIAIGKQKQRTPDTNKARIIEASQMTVVPGLIDMHVHLREPGFEHKETIRTGTMAAVKGGFTTVCCMPNTFPVNDNASVTEFIKRKASQEGYCTVLPIGAITKGQLGDELAEIGTMRKEGCIAFSDDGQPVTRSLLMRRALEYSKAFNVPVISHSEDLSLSEGGVMNEGLLSVTLGLRGSPAEAEQIMIFRDIVLAELTGGKLHIAHVSTKGSVDLIRTAKKRGVRVTAETCPHYFSITENAVRGYDTDAKVNPPLRTDQDIEAIKEGLRDGTIDVIATDHAPHHRDEKLREFDMAPSGISGLETALGLSMSLVEKGILTFSQLIEKMALNPAKILQIDQGTLSVGGDADVTIIDPAREFRVEPAQFISKGKNTPFKGWLLRGTPVFTFVRGTIYEW